MTGGSGGSGDESSGRDTARVRHFLSLLGSGEEVDRWKAAEALGRLGMGEAVDGLIEALSDPDWRVRQKAAWALKEIGDARAIPHLRRLLTDRYEGVKDMAEEAIRVLGSRTFRENG